jgi:hypothetical protein
VRAQLRKDGGWSLTDSQQGASNVTNRILPRLSKYVAVMNQLLLRKIRQTVTLRQNIIPLCLATTTICFAIGAVQIESEPDIVVSDRYSGPGIGELRIKGVCDVQEASISCWDWDRKPNRDLADEVKSYCSDKGRDYGGFSSGIPFRFRRKNRIAVLNAPVLAYNSSSDVRLQGFLGPEGSPVQDLRQFTPNNDPVVDHLLSFNTEPEMKSTSLYATLMFKIGRTTAIPPVIGQFGKFGDKTINIDSVRYEGNSPVIAFGPMPGKYWNVVFKISGDNAQSKLDLQVEPLTKKGAPAMFVDDSGKPFEMPKNGQQPNMFSGASGAPRFYPIFFGSASRYEPEVNGRTYRCGVDPKYLSAFIVTLSQPKTVVFKGVPLDSVK